MVTDFDRPTRGHTIDLIRWQLHRDGWKADTTGGIYLKHTRTHWILEISGQAQHLPRNLWARYAHTETSD